MNEEEEKKLRQEAYMSGGTDALHALEEGGEAGEAGGSDEKNGSNGSNGTNGSYVKAAAPKAVEGVVPKDVKLTDPTGGVESRMSYVDMFRTLSPDKPLSDEEIAAEQKREKRNAVFSAIGDGISALSNLYFTAQGAPNAYNYTPQNSLSERSFARREQLRKEREGKKQQYMTGYMKAAQMDEERNRNKLLDALKERQQKRLEKKEEIAAAKNEAYMRRYEALAKKDLASAAYWEAKANALEAGKSLEESDRLADIARKNAQANASNASANLNNAKAEQVRNSGGDGGESTTEVLINRNKKGQETGRTIIKRTGSGGNSVNSSSGNRYDQYEDKTNSKKNWEKYEDKE